MTDTHDLLASWHKLAQERHELSREFQHHGVNSQARARLLRLDRVLGGKLLDIGDELRSRGVDPMRDIEREER